MHFIGEISTIQNFFREDFVLTDESINILKEYNSLELLETFKQNLYNLEDFTDETKNMK